MNHFPDNRHPWTDEKGWDHLEVRADSRAELDTLIEAARRKFWEVWICDAEQRMALLYKPSGALAPWEDSPAPG